MGFKAYIIFLTLLSFLWGHMSEVLWADSFGSGDFAGWDAGQGPTAPTGTINEYGAGNKLATVSSEYAHSGSYSGRIEVDTLSTVEGAGLSVGRQYEKLKEGYFSCWFMYPYYVNVGGWLDHYLVAIRNDTAYTPAYYTEIRYLGGGIDTGMRLSLTEYNQRWDIPALQSFTQVNPGEWFHFECYYKMGFTDGRVTCYHNEMLMWDEVDVDTIRGSDPNGYLEFSALVYGTETSTDVGDEVVMHFDDCVLSTARQGMVYPGDVASSGISCTGNSCSITGQQVVVSSDLVVNNTVNVETDQTLVVDSDVDLTIQGNFSVGGSVSVTDTSSLDVRGCVNIDQNSAGLDVIDTVGTNGERVVLRYDCINGQFSQVNVQGSCDYSATQSYYRDHLTVYLNNQRCDESSVPVPAIIAVLVIGAIIIVVGVIAVCKYRGSQLNMIRSLVKTESY